MPIYEYACQACEHQFETIQKINEDPLVECPSCGKPSLKKLVSRAAFRLKGGGWYETDFKSDGKRNIAGEPAKDATKGAGGDSGSSSGSDSGAGSDTSGAKSSSSSDGKSESKKSASAD